MAGSIALGKHGGRLAQQSLQPSIALCSDGSAQFSGARFDQRRRNLRHQRGRRAGAGRIGEDVAVNDIAFAHDGKVVGVHRWCFGGEAGDKVCANCDVRAARFHLLDNLVWAQFAAQAYGDAIHTAEQSLREADFAGTRLCLVLCLVGAGQLDRAAAQLSALKTLAPDMVAARLQGVWLATDPEVCGREVAFLAAAVRRMDEG